MRVRPAALVSTLIVDADKDWGGHKISNLGLPTVAGDALRLGDESLIDHDLLLHYVAAQHLALPAAIASVLTDHDLAHHPLSIIPTMDVAHIPDLDAGKIVSGIFALARIPTPLTGKDADTLDGLHGSSYAVITAGSYTGDGTDNRAIPHGLGRTPKLVHIVHQTNSPYDDYYLHGTNPTKILDDTGTSHAIATVTAMNGTNFYVRNVNGANTNGYTYYWVAIG